VFSQLFEDFRRVTVVNDKNGGSRFKNRPRWVFDSLKRLPPHYYFQSLKMSFRAASIAALRLFCMMLMISASRMDYRFFFLFSWSDLLWLI
jgi:hypothetical protein